jgi:hypothetical protein
LFKASRLPMDVRTSRDVFRGYAQAVGPVEHPQSGGPPVARPASTPAAHPTPARTAIALTSQFRAQAPHSMQAPRSARTARLFCMTKTA